MKKIVIGLVALTFLISCNSVNKVQSEKTSKQKTLKEVSSIPIGPNVKKGVLSNGMTYYIRQNAKPEQKVELRLVVNAGSILEDEKQLGLAHFMEHMNFNGSKNFNKNELVDYLQSIGVKFGAHLNAYTSFDETVYILPIPTDNEEKLEKGFQILEDWAFNASLTDEEIDKERGVVLEEYRLGLGAGKRMLSQYLPKLMYNSHYAERLPIGTKKSLETFTYEDLRRFYKDWYRPDLMAVVAVGDVDVAVLEAKIKAHFGKYKPVKNPKDRKKYKVPNHEQTLISVATDKEASSSQIQLYYKDKREAKQVVTKADYRKNIVKNLFVSMINKRLEELRNKEKPPFVYGYSTYGGTWARDKNAYQSGAMSSDTGQLEALKALAIENKRALQFGFQQGELNRVKKALLTGLERAYNERDKSESRSYASEYINNFLVAEVIPGIAWEFETHKELVPTITVEECNALIAGYIHEDNRVVILTGPEKKDGVKITEAQVLQVFEEVRQEKVTAYEDKVIEGGLMNFIPKKGAIVKVTKDDKIGATTLFLSNGAKLTYKKTNFKNDQVLFSAFSYGGTSLYSDADFKKTSLANGALTEAGVNGLNKTDLGKVLAGKIVRLRPYIGSLKEGFSGATTPKDMETLFQMTHLYFTKLNLDAKAYNSFVAKNKAYLKNILSNPSVYFRLEFGKYLANNNPRFIGFPTEELWDATDYKLAYEKYQERFADAGDFNFYVVGNFDEAKLTEYAVTYLAGLPAIGSKEYFKSDSHKPLTGISEKHVKKGTEPKSMVNIIYQGEATYNAKEAYYLRSLGEILTIKLVEQLREEEAGVYGVGARGSISRFPKGSYNFSISFPCGPENVDKLTKKSLEQLQNIMDNGPTEKDLNKVKETQLLEYKERIKKNNFWLGLLESADFNKKDRSEALKAEDKINALTAKNIQEIAKKYLVKNRIIGTLNPE